MMSSHPIISVEILTRHAATCLAPFLDHSVVRSHVHSTLVKMQLLHQHCGEIEP